ncbi:hypothetical protein ACOSP7_026912 [Xanthoceras sorbifolium]
MEDIICLITRLKFGKILDTSGYVDVLEGIHSRAECWCCWYKRCDTLMDILGANINADEGHDPTASKGTNRPPPYTRDDTYASEYTNQADRISQPNAVEAMNLHNQLADVKALLEAFKNEVRHDFKYVRWGISELLKLVDVSHGPSSGSRLDVKDRRSNAQQGGTDGVTPVQNPDMPSLSRTNFDSLPILEAEVGGHTGEEDIPDDDNDYHPTEVYKAPTGGDVDASVRTSVVSTSTLTWEERPPNNINAIVVYKPLELVNASSVDVGIFTVLNYGGQAPLIHSQGVV